MKTTSCPRQGIRILIITTRMLTQSVYVGGIGPWPFHEPTGRPVKPKFTPLSSEMMVLQGPPMVAIETSLLATAVSLGEGKVSVCQTMSGKKAEAN